MAGATVASEVLLQTGALPEEPAWYLGMVVAAFAGGLFAAAIGALPAFGFTGFMVVAGETANVVGFNVGQEIGTEGMAAGITESVAFGPFFGPHVSFAAGAAAAAYAAKQGYMDDTEWGYHHGKNILLAHGTNEADVLLVGGAFGVLGFAITHASGALLGLPWDPIAVGVVLSALAHRLFLGYGVIGHVRGSNVLDVSPFEREELYATDGGTGSPAERLAAEPWLPWQYEWTGVVLLGFAVGALGGLTYYATGSPFLAFGISAATLIFLNLGFEGDFYELRMHAPVTHHITLPASTAPMAYAGIGLEEGAGGVADLGAITLPEAVLLGAAFGLLGAVLGELAQRIFYMHGDTHWDPPATSIVVTTLLIALLGMAGIFESTAWIPNLEGSLLS